MDSTWTETGRWTVPEQRREDGQHLNRDWKTLLPLLDTVTKFDPARFVTLLCRHSIHKTTSSSSSTTTKTYARTKNDEYRLFAGLQFYTLYIGKFCTLYIGKFCTLCIRKSSTLYIETIETLVTLRLPGVWIETFDTFFSPVHFGLYCLHTLHDWKVGFAHFASPKLHTLRWEGYHALNWKVCTPCIEKCIHFALRSVRTLQ